MPGTDIPKELNDYIEANTTAESPVLAALNRETNVKRGDAVMLSGHLQGAFLQMISHMIKPEQILEIGTFTGYSAICLAQGLTAGGQLHTIEVDEELHDIAADHITKAGLRSRITQHTGPAADVIRTLNGQFDLVFIDADKAGYERYYDLVFDKVRIGGYILADNVLYDGEVLLPENAQTKNARAITSFNKKIKSDDRITHVLVPLRDGIMLMRKVRD
jgi:caffeoyl-CoA O-methyltransferase